MRVNVYGEELTDRIEILTKKVGDVTFTGVRFYLELPVTKPIHSDGVIVGRTEHKGPFIQQEGDDDTSAVTFWSASDLRDVLRKGIAALDHHYLVGHGG